MPTLRDPKGIAIRWDGRNLVAEEWLREHSATLVSSIIADL